MKTSYQDIHDSACIAGRAPELTQHVVTKQGTIELNFQYLCESFSEFHGVCRFRHHQPLYSRLIMVESGTVRLKFSDSKWQRIEAGDFYFLPSGHSFWVDYSEGCVTKGFHLYLRNRIGLLIGKELPELFRIRDATLTRMLQELIVRTEPGELHAFLMVILLRMLQDELPGLRQKQELSSACRQVVEQMKRKPSLEVTFSQLAAKQGISLSSLSKQFRRQTGQTLQRYRQRLLIEKAGTLLTETEQTAGEIAAELGFSDPNYFFVFFKKATGQTPLDYRRAKREEKAERF